MKELMLAVWMGLMTGGMMVMAAPLRVAVLDFENEAAAPADLQLGGWVQGERFAEKATVIVGRELLREPGCVLIDRREFIRQVEMDPVRDDGRRTTARPSFLHAAQVVGADVVLRGQVLYLSTGKQVVEQGGYRTERVQVALGVSLAVLDSTDGTVVAVADGEAREQVRQTEEVQTVFGEAELFQLLESAVEAALPDVRRGLTAYQQRLADRPRVALTVTTTADPALVEIDGVLVGSTPLENFEVYQGDHVITVGKPAYRDLTKRILVNEPMSVEFPLFRVELTAEERQEILKQVRFNAYLGVEPAVVIERVRDAAR